jgi:hypothetical protein
MGAVLLAMAAATGQAALEDGERNGKGKKAMSEQVTVEPGAEGQWRVRARRQGRDLSGEGVVLMRASSRPDPVPPALVALAGARAWLGLAQKRLEASDWEGAAALARQGLAELGPDYAKPEVDDSTDLKVHAAEELIQKGQLDNGARTLTRTLENRIVLSVDRQRALLAE